MAGTNLPFDCPWHTVGRRRVVRGRKACKADRRGRRGGCVGWRHGLGLGLVVTRSAPPSGLPPDTPPSSRYFPDHTGGTDRTLYGTHPERTGSAADRPRTRCHHPPCRKLGVGANSCYDGNVETRARNPTLRARNTIRALSLSSGTRRSSQTRVLGANYPATAACTVSRGSRGPST